MDVNAVLKVAAEMRERADRVGASLGELSGWAGALESAARGGGEAVAYLVVCDGLPSVYFKEERARFYERICGATVSPLYTTPPAPAAPDGWKLVPVEPTKEMVRAAQKRDAEELEAYLASRPDRHDNYRHCGFEASYEAMLSAAPSPEFPR